MNTWTVIGETTGIGWIGVASCCKLLQAVASCCKLLQAVLQAVASCCKLLQAVLHVVVQIRGSMHNTAQMYRNDDF